MDRDAGRRFASTLAAHSVDGAITLLVVAVLVYSMRVTNGAFYAIDDLQLIRASGSASDILNAFNGHLSVVILSLYRALVEVFGFNYTPVRLAGVLSFVSMPVAYYVTTQRFLTAPLAALLSLPLLLPTGVDFYPGSLNQYLALTGGIGCAAALNRGPRADGVLAGSLVFSLCASGVGVAVGVACVAHNLLARSPLRRWIATAVPLLAWATWWLALGRDASAGRVRPSVWSSISFAGELTFEALRNVALGSSAVAAALVVGLVCYGAWLLRQGIAAASNLLAWFAAVLFWGIGVSMSRGGSLGLSAGNPDAFRYQVVAIGFLLLAVVPRRPLAWPVAARPVVRRWLPVIAVGILVAGSARAFAVRGAAEESAMALDQFGKYTRSAWVEVSVEPEVVPDGHTDPGAFGFGRFDAGSLRALFARYGQPFPADPVAADAALVELSQVDVRTGALRRTCTGLTEPVTYSPSILPLYLSSDAGSWAVEARRFGDVWHPVASGAAGEVHRVYLRGTAADRPWEVRATGACRVGRLAWDAAEPAG